MGYQLHWIGKEILGYYLSGTVSKDFDVQKENEKLIQWVSEGKDIAICFEHEEDMLLLKKILPYSESLEEQEDFFYLLDEGLIELVESHPHEPNLSLYLGIAALQYFQFDTLKDIMDLSEQDLEKTSVTEKEDIQDIQKIFKDMKPKEREAFLEQELFCYTESELVQWLENLGGRES